MSSLTSELVLARIAEAPGVGIQALYKALREHDDGKVNPKGSNAFEQRVRGYVSQFKKKGLIGGDGKVGFTSTP